MIITMAHLRSIPGYGPRPGFCARGSRQFFARYGLDWDDFRRNGIDAEKLRATGDALALAVIEHAQRMADGRQ